MSINPNVALGFQQPHFNSPLDNFGKGLSLQHLMLQNATAESALADAPKLRQLAMEKAGLQMQQERDSIAKQSHDRNVGIAKAVLSADPATRPGVYKQIVNWAAANGDKSLPPEWDESLVPGFQALAASQFTAEQAQEAANFREVSRLDAGQPTPAKPVAPAVPATAQDIADERNQIAQTGQITADDVGVVVTDESKAMRKKASLIRQQGKTKQAFDYAKHLDDEADKLDALNERTTAHEEMMAARKEAIQARLQGKSINVTQTTTKLADDFRQEPAVKDYRTVQPLVASMENAVGKDTAASDLDMVYAIAKIFDPGSVVREGEQIMIVNAGGLPSKVQSWIGFVNGGQRLSGELRQELLDQAHSRADNYKQAYDSAAKSYREQAKRWELNADDIVRDYSVTARHPGDGPKKDKVAPPKTIDWKDLK